MDHQARPDHPDRHLDLSYFLRLFDRLRWFGVIGTAAALGVCQHLLGFHLPYAELYGVVIGMIAYNAVFQFLVERPQLKDDAPDASALRYRRDLRAALTQTILDQISLFLLLHFSGGLENPFILLFLVHVVIAGALYERFALVLAASNAGVAIFALGILEKTGVLEHHHIQELIGDVEALDSWLFVLGLSGALVFVLVLLSLFIAVIMGERTRQREQILALVRESERQNAKLIRVDNMRRGLLAVASHDLKSPIAAVTSLLQLCEGGSLGPMTDGQRHVVSRSLKRLEALRLFVSDILSLNAIERGEIRARLQPTDLRALVAAAVEDIRPSADAKKQELGADLADGLPEIMLAPDRARQVLDNLLSNAIKYTPDGGAIRVGLAPEPGWVVLQVVDDGIGISPQDQKKLFQDFFRASSVKQTHDGTGLGLSLVRRIVLAHGGRIDVESELGRGSTFTVRFPVDPRAADVEYDAVAIMADFDTQFGKLDFLT